MGSGGRTVLAVVAAGLGLLLAAVVLAVGWQLPLEQDCGGGDACTTSAAVDWERVDWSIPPSRIACGVAHPGPADVTIGPGEECVTSTGGEQVSRTYEQLRTQGSVRRGATLAAVLVVLVATASTAVRLARPRGR